MEARVEFMQQAIALAVENVTSGRGGPFGAVIVKDGKVVATGANQVTATNDPTAHAEVTAIRNACTSLAAFQLEGCDIYTSCEPCPMCLAAIYWARCRTIYYGCTAEDAAQAGFDDAFLYGEMKKPCSIAAWIESGRMRARSLWARKRCGPIAWKTCSRLRMWM